MAESEHRQTLERYWRAIEARDFDAVRAIFADDVNVEWPQSGEHFRGKEACIRIFRDYPGGSPKFLGIDRLTGDGDVWTAEAQLEYPDGKRYHAVGIFQFREGKIVRETDYFAEPFAVPEWRIQWVDRPQDT